MWNECAQELDWNHEFWKHSCYGDNGHEEGCVWGRWREKKNSSYGSRLITLVNKGFFYFLQEKMADLWSWWSKVIHAQIHVALMLREAFWHNACSFFASNPLVEFNCGLYNCFIMRVINQLVTLLYSVWNMIAPLMGFVAWVHLFISK